MDCSNYPECDACKSLKKSSGTATTIVSVIEKALNPVAGAIGVFVIFACTANACYEEFRFWSYSVVKAASVRYFER